MMYEFLEQEAPYNVRYIVPTRRQLVALLVSQGRKAIRAGEYRKANSLIQSNLLKTGENPRDTKKTTNGRVFGT